MARKNVPSSMNAHRHDIPADEELWICLDIGGANVRASKCRDVDYAPTAVAALNSPDAQGGYGYKWGWDALKIIKANPTKYTLYTHMKHVLAQLVMDGMSDETLYNDEEPNASKESGDGTPMALERAKVELHGHDLDNMARFFVNELARSVLLQHAEECPVIVLCSVPCHFDPRRASRYTRNLNAIFPDNAVLRELVEDAKSNIAELEDSEVLPTIDQQTWEKMWVEVRKQDNELNLRRGEVISAHLKEHNNEGTITLTGGAWSSMTLRSHLEETLRAAVPKVNLQFVADSYESSASRKSFDHVLHGLQLVAEDPTHATASTAQHNLFMVDHVNPSMNQEEVRYIWAWKLGAAFDEIATQPEINWKPTLPIPMYLSITTGLDEQFEIDLSFRTSVTPPKLCERANKGAFNLPMTPT
ncbi:hypothetical protein LTR17_026817 [Elasticomyces elasticus]|nr:hypothetical protein LTR17_026817 [Elasticomyces elasticus]